jgi:hypothetical protein
LAEVAAAPHNKPAAEHTAVVELPVEVEQRAELTLGPGSGSEKWTYYLCLNTLAGF